MPNISVLISKDPRPISEINLSNVEKFSKEIYSIDLTKKKLVKSNQSKKQEQNEEPYAPITNANKNSLIRTPSSGKINLLGKIVLAQYKKRKCWTFEIEKFNNISEKVEQKKS
ncbi:15906_t:CDS:2 [Racocetra fulgida]|uniref:15906_t:CDS:1 n=1 Tax=Racocetra fulgida TaxID=60492 RepID=A0A9N8ZYC7_9GLOM|nr:15906_t:CDS:2 [Racocetra fulgida]